MPYPRTRGEHCLGTWVLHLGPTGNPSLEVLFLAKKHCSSPARDQIVVFCCICTAVFHIPRFLGSSESSVQEEEAVRDSK